MCRRCADWPSHLRFALEWSNSGSKGCGEAAHRAWRYILFPPHPRCSQGLLQLCPLTIGNVTECTLHPMVVVVGQSRGLPHVIFATKLCVSLLEASVLSQTYTSCIAGGACKKKKEIEWGMLLPSLSFSPLL